MQLAAFRSLPTRLSLCALLRLGGLAGVCYAAAQDAAAAQDSSPAPAPSSGLALVSQLAPGTLDAEALRTALERELEIPVRSAEHADGAHLAVSASATDAVKLTFVRADGTTIERTVDVSTAGEHAPETLGLVAANLMRDEAADLLANLRAVPIAPLPPSPAPAASAPPPPAAPVPLPPPPRVWAHGCEPTKLRRIPIGLDVLPYLGMSARDGTNVERTFSFNLLGGLTGAVRGFELSGFLNLDALSVCGVQISGAANLVDGPVRGAQFGMVNWSSGRVDGAQFGLVSGALGPLNGVQYGTALFAGGDIHGAQFGLAAVGAGSLTGAQFGLANVAAGDVTGAQFGLAQVGAARVTGAQLGLANVAAGGLTGAQLGLANVSAADARGLQLGLANVTNGRMRGAMIGFLNTAADADAAIGAVNVLWNGRTHLDVWTTDFGLVSLGLEHGSRYVHNIYGFGLSSRDGRLVFAPTYGIGVRVMQTSRWFLDIDALAHALFVHDKQNDEYDHALISTLRIPITYRILPALAVFVSPAINVSVADADDLLADPSLLGSSTLTDNGAKTRVTLWPGFAVGARFF